MIVDVALFLGGFGLGTLAVLAVAIFRGRGAVAAPGIVERDRDAVVFDWDDGRAKL